MAGHPEGHTDGKGQPSLSSSSPSQEDHGESGGEEEERLELQRLKEKVAVRVCVFIKLHITAQSSPAILVILYHSH